MNKYVLEILKLIKGIDYDKEAVTEAFMLREETCLKLLPLIKNHFLELQNNIIRNEANKIIKEIEVKNLAIIQQLRTNKKLITQANTRHILLKGVAFNSYLYEGKGIRDVNDIDILVKDEDLKKTLVVLCKEMQIYNREGHGPMQNDYEYTLVPRRNVGFNLDLHINFFYSEFINIERLNIWENTSVIRISGMDFEVLNNELALIHQAIHSFKDLNYDRYSIIDTYLLMSRGVDLNKVYSLAKSSNTLKVLEYFLYRYELYIRGRESGKKRIMDLLIKKYSCSLGRKRKIVKFIFYFLLMDKKIYILKFMSRYISNNRNGK